MRQVPHYLIIGNGRVSRHFQAYLRFLKLPFDIWHRSQPQAELPKKINNSSHVLILTSDFAIEAFAQQYLQHAKVVAIHFSGSLVSDSIYGAHPLMSFNESVYTSEQYQEIPFVIDDDAPDWSDLMPGFPNPHVRLKKQLKPKYHALCVLSGNFSCLLWQKLMSAFEHELHLPPTIAHSYLNKQTANLISNPATALTGPLVRNDLNTIAKNLAALDADPFKEVYESFVNCYQKITSGELA